mmetsp:Transcript_35892/g.76582  ORF Transcript_35892/g.76582 Transcript_35892/m.76582 type:complete len:101 (-) Transcript_35892:21-323(-)
MRGSASQNEQRKLLRRIFVSSQLTLGNKNKIQKSVHRSQPNWNLRPTPANECRTTVQVAHSRSERVKLTVKPQEFLRWMTIPFVVFVVAVLWNMLTKSEA